MASVPPDRATPPDTRAYAAAMSGQPGIGAAAYRPLGRTGLTVSTLGFGGYRVHDSQAEHRLALGRSLSLGVNLIDTSSNYSDGGSEALVGRVVGELAAARGGGRGRLVIVSKAGYVQGGNMEVAQEALSAGDPFPEMVEYHPQCWHCIHPRFLGDQLERSLERLGAQQLDVYLLHNPEYFLTDWAQRNPQGDLAAARGEFYRRMEAAFGYLEEQVRAGRIQWYGVSSNSFGYPARHAEFVSLEALLAQAAAAARRVQGAGGDSHFGVVQCPLNLFEGGAALERNQQGGRRTFLELAAQSGLGVLINRPLNAIHAGHLMRLADPPPLRADWEAEQRGALDRLEAVEQDFARRFRPAIAEHLPRDAAPMDPFNWSAAFRKLPPELNRRDAWLQALNATVYPQVQRNGQAVAQALTQEPARADYAAWFGAYAEALEAAAGLIGEGLGRSDLEQARAVRVRLEPLLPAALRAQPLSQIALQVVNSIAGVTCILNGMRQTRYVEDSLTVLGLPVLTAAEALAILRGLAQGA